MWKLRNEDNIYIFIYIVYASKRFIYWLNKMGDTVTIHYNGNILWKVKKFI